MVPSAAATSNDDETAATTAAATTTAAAATAGIPATFTCPALRATETATSSSWNGRIPAATTATAAWIRRWRRPIHESQQPRTVWWPANDAAALTTAADEEHASSDHVTISPAARNDDPSECVAAAPADACCQISTSVLAAADSAIPAAEPVAEAWHGNGRAVAIPASASPFTPHGDAFSTSNGGGSGPAATRIPRRC